MSKPLEDHEWQIEIDGSHAYLSAKDQCRGPFHEETCERYLAEAEWRREHSHVANKAETVESDMGVVHLAVGDIVLLGREPESWPDCTCEEPPGEPCICWEDWADLSELVNITLDVKLKYHYSYDAYHKETDAWIEIKEASLAGS